jgi:alginate O-acetyltransferase complex protein AlgI
VVVMFHLVCFGWIFFRADNFSAAFAMLEALVTRGHAQWAMLLPTIAEMAILAGIPFALEVLLDGERHLERLARAPVAAQCAVYSYAVAMLLFLHSGRANAFIYFQF